jgi:hypothetical protein
MTEEEWLGCKSPWTMLRWVRASGKADRSQLGLLFAACCDSMPLVHAQPKAGYFRWLVDPIALTDAEFHLFNAVAEVMRAIGDGDRERAGLLVLMWDIFGNPFRPVTVDPTWRSDTAVSLAKQMYEMRDFSAMSALGDALQDAGCDNADILNHCRDTQQTHVRGCWVVDLVLNKS